MAVYDFFLSRNSSLTTLDQYIGHKGRLFYDDVTGNIRISDGVTPGGNPIPITTATSTTAGAVKPGIGFTITTGGTLSLNAGPMFELDESDVFQLKPEWESILNNYINNTTVNKIETYKVSNIILNTLMDNNPSLFYSKNKSTYKISEKIRNHFYKKTIEIIDDIKIEK